MPPTFTKERAMKIAIVGTGQGYDQAPYGTDWQVWGLPGHYNTGKKFDRVYEVHSPQAWVREGLSKEKFDWMKENVTHCHHGFKTTFKEAEVIDFKKHIDKYGEYFTSTIAWMLAEAMELKPKEIAIYGVTMSHAEEYAHQKPACSYLIGWAKAQGIKVTAKMSEIMSAPWIYGYEEVPDLFLSLQDRKRRHLNQKEGAESMIFEAKALYHKMEGKLEEIEYFENNWFAGSKKDCLPSSCSLGGK